MYNKILIAFDGSEPSLRAVEHAAELAKTYNSEKVTLFEAIHNVPMNDPMFIVHYYQVEDDVNELTFEPAKKILNDKGVAFDVKVLHGDPGTLITQFANEEKYNLIVVGGTGKGLIKKAILGSVSSYVATTAKCPVLVVK
ncbi:MAG: universal stress protein [Bacillales bacterium]|jgi:nucleotide-binding universal stress UspA family protein|nr:universal stress protein [Bacillales bacterium]